MDKNRRSEIDQSAVAASVFGGGVTNARPEKQWPMVNDTARRAFGAALFQDQQCRRLPRSLDAERAALDQVWGSSSGHQHGRGLGVLGKPSTAAMRFGRKSLKK